MRLRRTSGWRVIATRGAYLVREAGQVGALHTLLRVVERVQIRGRQRPDGFDTDHHPRVPDGLEHLGDAVVHVADQVPDGGDVGRAERQLAGRGRFYAHLCFQRRREHPVALPQVQRVRVEQVFRDVEQAQPLRTGSGIFWTRQHEVEQVLRGVTDVAAGDEPLHTLDVPGAVRLRNRLGAPRADVGTRVGFGQRHGAHPASFQTDSRPLLLLFGADEPEHLRHDRSAVPQNGRVRADHHLVDRPGDRGRSRHPTDHLGHPYPPPPGILERGHGRAHRIRHRDRVLARDEPRRVAVGLDERVCNRPLGQPRHLAENLTHRRGVQITVGARIEHRVEAENLEQVELQVAHVRSVMAHRLSPPRSCTTAH